MSSPGTFRFGQVSSTPSPPPTGYDLIYVKTDDVLYIQDSAGVEVALGSASAITSLTGEVTATGPGAAVATVSNSAVIGKVLTGFTPGPNSIVLSTDTILQAFEKLQAQVTASSGSAITALTGDVTATGPGSVPATVNSVGGKTASDIAGSVTTVDAATSSNTASTLVKRDASGNFSANTITANLSGNATSATTATTATNFTGSLSGDVTGTQSATVVSFVGTKSASDIANAVTTVDNATSTNTASTLVERDASGNFSANVITASLTGNVTGNVSGSSSSFTGSLSGDVTGTQNATSISSTTVTGKLLTGYTTGTATPLIATNSILTAFENLQAQVSSTTGAAITALTGDVVATGPGSATATIQPNVVTNSKLAQMPADTIKGNNTGSTANALDLTIPQIVTMFEGTPVTQIPDQSNAIGVTNTFAVADHIHNIPSGVPVQVGTSNIQGSAHSFSLADHVHALTASVTTGQLLTGYTTGTNTPITATNSILTAFENLQAQVSATGGAAITALTGDVSATGPGSAAATVNSVGGSTAASVHSTVVEVAAATSADTPSTLVIRDSSGNFSAGTITATLNGNATNITASSNSTLTTLPNLSLPTSQLTGVLPIANGGTNNSTAYTAGSIIFSNGTSLTQDNANFFWNDTNQSVGIGTTPAAATFIDAVNTSGSAKRLVFTGYGTGSTVGFRNRFARGTSGTPAAAQTGDTLGFISGQGYGASQFPTSSTGAANFVAGETFTNTSNQTYFTVNTTPTGSVTSTENFRVASTGLTLGPQSASTSIHQINGGQNRTNKTITANYTVDTTTTDDIIYCNASTAITITLPTPTSGRTLTIKDISGAATANNITIVRHASENIEGLASSYIMSVSYQTVMISSDGTNWWIF